MYPIKKLLSIVLKIFTSKISSHSFQNKGGWPGLRVLPKVDNLIDVGIGHQGTEGLYKFFPQSRKFFIDPLIETKAALSHHLNDPKNKFIECGLSSSQGCLEISVRDPISQSGFHYSDSDQSRIISKRTVKVETLDKLFPIQKLGGTWGIKIDVEGHESEVLLGGVEFLKYCTFVIVEVEINIKKFKNSTSFAKLTSWMFNQGFEVASVRASGDGTDHADIAFLRNKSNEK